MAFTFLKFPHEVIVGDQKMISGTFSNNDGSTGGIIQTGLHYVNNFTIQHTGAAAVADSPSVKSPLKSIGGVQRLEPDVEIKTTANASGIWVATGV